MTWGFPNANPMFRQPPDICPRPVEALFAVRSCQRTAPAEAILCAQGDDADQVLLVTGGTLRVCLYGVDGQRQILRFARFGAVLGALEGRYWHVAAEAVDRVALRILPRRRLEAARRDDHQVDEAIHELARHEIERREAHLAAVAHLPAALRVLNFLQDFTARDPQPGLDGFTRFPMTRQDIADYLGLTIETVSRAISALRRSGRIELSGAYKVRICQDGPAGMRSAAGEVIAA